MPTGCYARRQAATSGSTGQCCGGSTHSGGNSRKRVDPTCCDGWSGSGSKSRGVVRFPHARLLRDERALDERRSSSAGRVPLGLFWTPSCVKERAMNRPWLEEQIRVQFGSQGAAWVAALHEVRVCVDFPECCPAVLQMSPKKTPKGATLHPPIARGKQCLPQCHGTAT